MRFNRRDFLITAGAAAAGLGAQQRSLSAETPDKTDRWRMRLSTSSIHFMELPIEQACEKIASLGFDAIDIWSAHNNCPHLDDVLTRLGPERLRKLLAKNRLKLYSFSTYRGGYARYAELLGASGGGVAVQGSTGACKPRELSSKMKQFIESLKPLAELAERYDSYLAIENHGNALLDSIDSIKAFVDTNRLPRIGIALAPYHIQARKESVTEAIQACGRQLMFFYAWQRAKGSEQLPGVGPTDMTAWLRALAAIEYKWYVNPFMHGHPGTDAMTANLAQSRDYLQTCYHRLTAKQDIRNTNDAYEGEHNEQKTGFSTS